MSASGNTFKNEFKPTPKSRTDKEKEKPAEKKAEKRPKSSERSQRFRKITGVVLMAFSVYMCLAFISCLFSWRADMDKVEQFGWTAMFQPDTVPTQNWMGIIGATLSLKFMYYWFGIASFLFLPIIFLGGVKILFGYEKINIGKIIISSVFWIFFTSLVFGFLFQNIGALSIMGGAFGFELQKYFYNLIGWPGIIILIIVLFLGFLIITYNINFRVPKMLQPKPKNMDAEEDLIAENEARNLVNNGFNAVPVGGMSEEDAEEEDIDEEEIKLVVKEEQKPVAVPLVVEKPIERPKPAAAGIELEIKQAMPLKPVVPAMGVVADSIGIRESNGSWYKYPELSLLKDHNNNNTVIDPKELEERKNQIVESLKNFKINIDKIEATIGPTVTLYEIIPEAGVRISKIKSLEDDIALSLSALGIRIIAPMPGKGTIGIEVPNKKPEMVALKEALASPAFKNSTFDLPVVLGKTISNEVFVADLAKMPHLLMAGATGQGKSVGINTIIASILFKKHPEDVKFILVDPKKVELSLFKHIEKHFLPELPDGQEAIITDTKLVVDVLKSLCVEMDDRYDRLKDAEVRNIKEYNKKIEKGQLDATLHHRLPYIILVIDELADLMMTAGKEVEMPICRLAQLARAIGIHLIIATQRPSVNIITGTIKANFPARIAFKVTSRIDSRTILDSGGAEQLIGNGDMLFSNGGELVRLQCPFIDTEEVDRLTKYIGTQPYPENFRLNIITTDENGEIEDYSGEMDPMFEEAARMVVRTQQGSTSMLQRRLKLGYNRAGRVMDQLEKRGIVGKNEGSKAREVLFADEAELEQFLSSLSK